MSEGGTKEKKRKREKKHKEEKKEDVDKLIFTSFTIQVWARKKTLDMKRTKELRT